MSGDRVARPRCPRRACGTRVPRPWAPPAGHPRPCRRTRRPAACRWRRRSVAFRGRRRPAWTRKHRGAVAPASQPRQHPGRAWLGVRPWARDCGPAEHVGRGRARRVAESRAQRGLQAATGALAGSGPASDWPAASDAAAASPSAIFTYHFAFHSLTLSARAAAQGLSVGAAPPALARMPLCLARPALRPGRDGRTPGMNPLSAPALEVNRGHGGRTRPSPCEPPLSLLQPGPSPACTRSRAAHPRTEQRGKLAWLDAHAPRDQTCTQWDRQRF